MKKKYIYISITSILLLVLLIIVILIIREKSLTNEIKNDNSPVSFVTPVLSSPVEINSKDYIYDYPYLTPHFQLSYPSDWAETFSDASGSYDINLEKGNRSIQIDLSGQENETFEQSLNDWITNFGSYNINYTFNIIKNGNILNGEYKIFEIAESSGQKYIIALATVGKMYEGTAYLAIKISSESDLSLLNDIFNSMKVFN